MKEKRRFIAGAVCPRCGEMDRVVMIYTGRKQTRECVACGFRDELSEVGATQELPTRVNQPRVGEKPLGHEEEVKALKILDTSPGLNRDDH